MEDARCGEQARTPAPAGPDSGPSASSFPGKPGWGQRRSAHNMRQGAEAATILPVRPLTAGRGPDAPPPRLHPPRPSRSPLSSFRRPCYFCLFPSATLPNCRLAARCCRPPATCMERQGGGRGHCRLASRALPSPAVGIPSAGPAPTRRAGAHTRDRLAGCHQLSLAQARLRREQGWFPGICRNRHGPGRTSLGGACGTAGGPRALWSVWCTAPPPLGMRGSGTEVERRRLRTILAQAQLAGGPVGFGSGFPLFARLVFATQPRVGCGRNSAAEPVMRP